MNTAMISLLVTLLLHAGSGAPELTDDPIVRGFCRLLAEKSLSDRTREHGAFVARTANGQLYFVVWPPGDEKDRLRWYGQYPEGTVAILHTHPGWQQAASNLDMKTARRKQIPVYVITTFGISKTTGGPSEAVVEGQWLNAKEGCTATSRTAAPATSADRSASPAQRVWSAESSGTPPATSCGEHPF